MATAPLRPLREQFTERFVRCALGLAGFGTGIAFFVKSHIGVPPWDVFHQGISEHTGLGLGTVLIIVAFFVLLLWIPLKERPGLGTIANAIVIATSLQVMLSVVPTQTAPLAQLVQVLLGIAAIGIGSGMYLTTHMGPGPRDGWMTGIHKRTGWPVYVVRLGIEVTVVVIGWLLGGSVGIGTVLFALLVGPAVGYGLRAMGAIGGTDVATVPEDEHPELDA